jgi:Vam6/Vps39-like protein vacuolar protein sorting-associated protein 39
MKPWNVQVDELVKEGAYEEALGLVGEIGIGEEDVDVNIHVQSTPPTSAADESAPKDISVSAPKVSLRKHLQTLSALSQFKAGNFDAAIDKFIELDVNPAKVLALYPSSVSGRLTVAREKWVGLFGGPETETTQGPGGMEAESPAAPAQTQDATSGGAETPAVPASPSSLKSQNVNPKESKFVPPDFLDSLTSSTSAPGSAAPPPPSVTLRGRFRGLGSLIGAGGAVAKDDDDTASVRSFNPFQGRYVQGAGEKEKEKEKEKHGDELARSVETLVKYLSDRRPQLGKLLDQHHITPSSSTFIPSPPPTSSTSTDADADAEAQSKPEAEPQPITPLSTASAQSLFTLPSVPLAQLTSLQLIRFAQMVDTALFKSYLLIRPSMLGPLCRLPNWCEVVQVEKELREHGKFNELRDLYGGKKMHDKALELLREQAAKKLSQYADRAEEDREDREDRLRPSIAYLQKLGPEYLSTIFAAAKWLLEEDKDLAFEIFTSEDVDLPRKEVVDYLEGVDASSNSSHHAAGAGAGTGSLAVRYLEWLISERKEESTAFHDRLAELYLKGTVGAKRRGDIGWYFFSFLLKKS